MRDVTAEKLKHSEKTDCKKPKVIALADMARNRLYLTLSGNIDTKSLEKLYTDIRFCLCDIQPNFDVIEDTSACNLLYITSLPLYKKIIDYLIAKKVGRVIRIIRNKSIFRTQFVNFAPKIQCYKAMYTQGIEEAEDRLKRVERRNGLRFKLFGPMIEFRAKDASGKGFCVDISTSGCAIESPTLSLSVDTDILLTLTFDEHETLASIFRINAKVVRVDNDMFAAQFLDFNEKEKLYQRLSHEVARTKCPIQK
jgi:hypothetical protein